MVDEIKATGATFRTGPMGRLGAQAQGVKSVSGSVLTITDRVEISELAMLLNKYAEMPGIRSERVAQIRAEIQAGTYETPEKWDQAVENLLEELRS